MPKLTVLTAYVGCLASLVMVLVLAGGDFTYEVPRSLKEAHAAAVFFVESITAASIQNDYKVATTSPAKVRILIVPGHEPDSGGTNFGPVYERDVVVDIANALVTLLSQNPRYEVTVSRTKDAWNPVLESYFTAHQDEILAYERAQAKEMARYVSDGQFTLETEQVYHNNAAPSAGLQLFGINMWARDNHYDITLHLHLNDYAGRRQSAIGKYSGFTIYVPDSQYSTAKASRAVAESIAARLSSMHATSTLPKEDQGVVEDRELIATGEYNTVDDAALLIEYGYIYEPQFQNDAVRSVAIADYAYETYLGLQDFFGDSVSGAHNSVSYPYDWAAVTARSLERGPGVYALQAALRSLGYYPAEATLSDCPVSGIAGNCTHTAIASYQRSRGLLSTGVLDDATRSALATDLKVQ